MNDHYNLATTLGDCGTGGAFARKKLVNLYEHIIFGVREPFVPVDDL
jgi:hypothetical protein